MNSAANPAQTAVRGDSLDHGPARPWLACVVPLAVFLLAGELEPQGNLGRLLGLSEAAYPVSYAARLVATIAVLAFAWPSIRPWLGGRPTWWPPLLGLALVVPWVVLATLQRDAGWTWGGARSGFDPFASLGDGPRAWGFLALRWLGLVAVVPIAEELFLRGFLMRYVINEEFWKVPFGLLTPLAAGVCALYAAATHPSEAVAAVGWFAMVTGIAAATRKPIDCMLAHAATNLALGIYVLATRSWWLM